MRNQPVRHPGERGLTAFLYTLALVFIIIPMLGLAIDVGFLYAVRSRMQASVDGAALAAARALSIGKTLDSQKSSAQSNAVTWFYANFPSNYFGVASLTMGTGNVDVEVDKNNAQLMDVTVTATAQVNTFFMRWLGQNTVAVGATGKASRRTVVAMLVLDRSGSMCQPGGWGCTETNTSYPCYSMIKAAKLFTGQFAAGSDYIGLISFSDNVEVQSAPTQNFQTTLGYTNSSSGTGQLDTITCAGYTSTAEGMSMAYQLIEQMNLPGALNVIVLETDGMPNSLTMSFYDAANKVTGLASGSGCKDTSSPTPKTLAGGGFNSTSVLPAWGNGMSLVSSPFLTYTGKGVPYSSLSNYMVGQVLSDDPTVTNKEFYLMYNYFTTSMSVASTLASGTVPGCAFAQSSGQSTTSPADIAWFPATDVFGNQLNPSAYTYQTVTTDAQHHITQNGWSNYHNAVLNATENSAYQARTNTTIPVTILVIGLGGNGAIDPVLLQRMANDPNGDAFNSTPQYNPCNTEALCQTWTTGSDGTNPQGTFIYSASASNLGSAFLRISSQMLRLSK